MYEVEVKVRTDHDEVRERLAKLGAEPVNEVTQEDTYYDAPHRDFAETDEALRVRRETFEDGGEASKDHEETPEENQSFAELTYKGPLVEAESKTRREVETAVEDGESADAILEALGFDATATVRKERQRFALDGFTVTLDAVTGLGEFVEVETEVEEDQAALETARERAYEILRDLGLDPDDQIRTSYLGLLLEARNSGDGD